MAWVDVATDVALLDTVWSDRPDDAVATILIDASHLQCVEFAAGEPDVVTARHKMANTLQARALHRAGYVGSGDSVGGEFPVTLYPMDWTVKNLIRPTPGIPVVG